MPKKKPEKESCTIKDVQGLRGQRFKEVTFVIFEGKLEAMKSLMSSPQRAFEWDLYSLLLRARAIQ